MLTLVEPVAEFAPPAACCLAFFAQLRMMTRRQAGAAIEAFEPADHSLGALSAALGEPGVQHIESQASSADFARQPADDSPRSPSPPGVGAAPLQVRHHDRDDQSQKSRCRRTVCRDHHFCRRSCHLTGLGHAVPCFMAVAPLCDSVHDASSCERCHRASFVGMLSQRRERAAGRGASRL